jgi:hypothetical protein
MKFNDGSSKQGLIPDISFLTGVDLNKYPLADRTRSINEWNKKVWTWAFESYGGWQLDDDNTSSTSDLPTGSISLVQNTAEYPLPSTALTVNKVDVLQSDGTTWITLTPLPLEMIGTAEGEFLKTANTPRFYRLVGDVIKLYPKPNYSGTNYLKVFFDRGMLDFAVTDTNSVPGFASPFHRVLSIGASLDYAIVNSPATKINSLSNLATDYEKRLKKFYSKRFKDNYPVRMRVIDSIIQYQ